MITATQIITAISGDPMLGPLSPTTMERSQWGAAVLLPKMPGVDWEPHLERVAGPLHWYVTRIEPVGSDIQYCLEAVAQPAVPVGRRVYHASRKANRSDIKRAGLVLSPSSRTWTGRSYCVPRIHFATSVDLALTYIESVVTGGPAVGGITAVGIAALRGWDIYSVDTRSEVYRADVEMTGAVWTTEAIDARNIRRLNMCFLKARLRLRQLFRGGSCDG